MLCKGVAAEAWMGIWGSCEGTPRMLPLEELEHESSIKGRHASASSQGMEGFCDCREGFIGGGQGIIWSAGVLSGRWSRLTVRTTRGT